MSGPKRTKAQREKDLAYIEPFYVKGWALRRIAAKISSERDYSLSAVQIMHDCHELIKRWQALQLKDIDKMKARELEKINKIESEAWRGWQRSLKNKERVTTGKRTGDEFMTEGQAGDPRFLQVVKQCIDKRCEILGLNTETKGGDIYVNTNVNTGKDTGDEARVERAADFLAKLGERGLI